MADGWSAEDIPDQSGRNAIVTGANSGLGLITARELARAGAAVVMACRNLDKGHAAAQTGPPRRTLRCSSRSSTSRSLASVRAFAERYRSAHDRLDLLINNAGVMASAAAPDRRRRRAPVPATTWATSR